MKIRQCFLELQLKMSGMFFLRHTVVVVELVGVVVSGPNVVSSSDGPSVLLSSRPRMSLSRFGSCCYSLCNDKSPT